MSEQFRSTIPLTEILDDLRGEVVKRRKRIHFVTDKLDGTGALIAANRAVDRMQATIYAIEHLMRQQGQEAAAPPVVEAQAVIPLGRGRPR